MSIFRASIKVKIIQKIKLNSMYILDSVASCFPLSSALRDRGFCLGRNTRMLAAQSPHRILHEAKVVNSLSNL